MWYNNVKELDIERSVDMMTIKEYRESARLTQSALAGKLGVTRTAVAMWETGESLPRASLLPQIADLLNCSIDDLFGRAKIENQ